MVSCILHLSIPPNPPYKGGNRNQSSVKKGRNRNQSLLKRREESESKSPNSAGDNGGSRTFYYRQENF